MVKQSQIAQVLESKIDTNLNIWKCQDIIEEVAKSHNWTPKPTSVIKVMKDQFGMRYRKVKPVPYRGNNPQSMILRQKFAQKMLELLDGADTIVNVDESWLNQTDFRNRKWRVRGATNSVKRMQLSARISVIAALSTNGDLFLSLTQVNTDSTMISMFLYHLSSKLGALDPHWRKSTVFLLDGAAYHRSSDTQ